MAVPLDEHRLAADVVKAVGEKEYVCLKGYILKTQDPGLMKFIPNLEDPSQYLLIPIEDIYYNHVTDEVPFRGNMIWANPRNIRRVEPSRPISTVRLQDADLQLTGLTGAQGLQAGDFGSQLRRVAPDPSDKFRCPNCGYWNSEKAQRCKQCGFKLQ